MRKRTRDLNVLMNEGELFALSELFHENTKMRWINARSYGTYIGILSNIHFFVKKTAQAYKSYPTHPQITLPRDFTTDMINIEEVIRRRRSWRVFSGEPIALEMLSKLLYFSYGITGSAIVAQDPPVTQFFRAVPSAGALYPLELYPVVFNVEGLQPGIYHYNVAKHGLELLTEGDFRESASQLIMAEELPTASLVIVITAVFPRSTVKYHDRGYRLILLDAGHCAQNLCLMSSALGLSPVPIGGFLDDDLNRLLGVDGVNESSLYPIEIGRPRTTF